jgi:hypothetical protein
MESGLWRGVAVKEEAVIDAFPRPVVEPTVAVAQTPEGDAIDVLDVGHDSGHGLAVGKCLLFKDFWRTAVRVGVDLGGIRAGFRVVALTVEKESVSDDAWVVPGAEGYESVGAFLKASSSF